MFPPPPRNERYLAAARVARGGVLGAPGGRVRLVIIIIRGVPAGFSAGGLFAGKGAGNKRKLEQKIENGKPI